MLQYQMSKLEHVKENDKSNVLFILRKLIKKLKKKRMKGNEWQCFSSFFFSLSACRYKESLSKSVIVTVNPLEQLTAFVGMILVQMSIIDCFY